MNKEIIQYDYTFEGAMVPPLTASPDGTRWRKAITGAAPPTCQSVAGFMELALTAANQAQNVNMYFGDNLSFDIDDLVSFEAWVKCSASLQASVDIAIGLASARNDAINSIADFALFRTVGNNTLVVESDDAVNDNDLKATGITLGVNVRKLMIDFATGINSVVGGLSTGGKANVIFTAESQIANAVERRVADGVRFDMSNYSAGLQPYFQIQKTATTDTGTLSIQRVRIMARQGG